MDEWIKKMWDFLIALLVKKPPAMQETLVQKIHWTKDRLPTPVFLGFRGGSAGKESSWNVGDLGSIPGLERSPGERNSYPLQYSGLENSMDYTVQGIAKSHTRLSDFHSDSDSGHIYNGILLSHKKEWNCTICRDVNGPRECHTEWSQKEKSKYCILMHICGI